MQTATRRDTANVILNGVARRKGSATLPLLLGALFKITLARIALGIIIEMGS